MKEKCPDCEECQRCAPARCRQCLKGGAPCRTASELGPFLTNREYLEWKRKKAKKIPVVDASRCTGCDSCLEVCAAVFRRNADLDLIEVVDLPAYPEEEVESAINVCPAGSIRWEREGA